MQRLPDSRLNATALLALLVGLFGTICFFWGIAGIGAIVLGVVAYSEIRRSEGRQHGQGLAIAGIVLGALHLLALGIGLAALFAFSGRPTPLFASGPGRAPKYLPPPKPVPATPSPAPTSAPERPGSATREEGTLTTRVGKVTLVDPGVETKGLHALLESQATAASSEREKLVLWISAVDCAPCNGVSIALRSKRMQEALAGVRFVRVDAADYRAELVKLGLPIDVTPGFAIIGSGGTPADYVNGGEWDADIPENIAPVLGSFVRGTYRARRNAWTGPRRGDETAL